MQLSDLGPIERAEKVYNDFLSVQNTALSSYNRRKAAKECAVLHFRLELGAMAPHLTDAGKNEYSIMISHVLNNL